MHLRATWRRRSPHCRSRTRDVQIGSYPFFEQKRLGTYIVLRASDPEGLQSAYDSLWTIIVENGFAALRSEDE